MILFFGDISTQVIAVEYHAKLLETDIKKLIWLFGHQRPIDGDHIQQAFIGPRPSMITPWSTNAVEITRNMGIANITRMEQFFPLPETYDKMIFQAFSRLDQEIFTVDITPEPIQYIDDIHTYNQSEGLALSTQEVDYLEHVSKKIGRKLTDSEVFGFSQINSEHCRHKIFNGQFIIDGQKKNKSLFQWIKQTSQTHPNSIVSAYKDNVALVQGPTTTQFAPAAQDKPASYTTSTFASTLSLKAETHNFPTTVEPFSGAATGSGGEIRDRLAGGQGSIPLAGTAVYMTPYSRIQKEKPWGIDDRDWLYQTPLEILIKASNGASDFGNKFGQPLITGSVLTFEHEEQGSKLGYDKVIMQAGGIGYAKVEHAEKLPLTKGDKIVILGGDNYRIGMGGAAVSSTDTGDLDRSIELNAVQRSNPEMQKRAANVIRAMVESSSNAIKSIHDHGAGGHLNCLSELVEKTGGSIDMDKLPIGDHTLSAKELIGNESQERMGLVVSEKDIDLLQTIADRERCPMYVVGEVTE
ncbi:MAG: phosphoribosylformylglycinamidine synthase, partial [Deltaproteobacteria bacterium]|nr:phosphoribosylformylglycinamidine synthase [Deltaproteobacteria bacterium]